MFNYRKVGGLHHWRIGRVGGSFYLRKGPSTSPSSWVDPAIVLAGPIAIIILTLIGG